MDNSTGETGCSRHGALESVIGRDNGMRWREVGIVIDIAL
jgi:hypothetical protein